jgi:hypothetical protein
MINNYTLGRGKLLFGTFLDPLTREVGDYRYIGNTPEFSLTIDSETLDHFSSDEGIKEKDDSVPLSVTRTGSFTTDNIDPDNVALFFFGEKLTVTQGALAAVVETLTGVKRGRFYQIGESPTNPVGVRGITAGTFAMAVAGGGAGGVPRADVDYKLNPATGLIEILDSSLADRIAEGGDVTITYSALASTRSRVISGSEPKEGAMIYIANNPKGDDIDYRFPYVKITPNGDYALKGDEYQSIPFNFEALKSEGKEAIYAEGRPKFA